MNQVPITAGNITSRYGKIEFIHLFAYKYSQQLHYKKDIKQKLISWLNINQSLQLFRFTASGFETLKPLPEENWQYKCLGIKKETPPIANIAMSSQYLHQVFDIQLSKIYKKHGEDFVYENVISQDFNLALCFNFNVELFDDGRFLIHFFATSHIGLSNKDIQHVMNIVRSKQNDKEQYFPKIFISDVASGKLKAIFPLSKKSMEEHDRFVQMYHDIQYSFDYQFMGHFFPTILTNFMCKSKVKISAISDILHKASSALQGFDGLRLHELPLLSVKLQSVIPEKNLIIGNNKIVSKLSAIYYSGLFGPVKDKYILPLLFMTDESIVHKTKVLIDQHFNINGNISWLPAMHVSKNENNLTEIIKLKKQYPSVFVMIFANTLIHREQIQYLRDNRIRYQIMQLPTDQYRLSNFAVKCLHKLGAKVSRIKDSGLPKDGYFVGIDLGHFHKTKDQAGYSSLIMVFYNTHGEHLFSTNLKDLPLNEALHKEAIHDALGMFKKHLTDSKVNMPTQLIFHRDGKLHSNDTAILNEGVSSTFGITDVNIVEIIKSGHPYLFTQKDHRSHNALSGQYWAIKDKDYALLITNDQQTSPDEALKPIVIKRKYGQLSFELIISQVYWFCKIYTNNIYYPTRLPATTELANNRAGTGTKQYKASYRKD